MQDKEELLKLGKHIKTLRLNHNLSLENFCFKNAIEPSTLSRIENGIVEAKYLTLLKISKAFGLTLSELLDFNNTNSNA